jgi:hypothetical protein
VPHEIELPPDLADALRRYFQVYSPTLRLLSPLCYQTPVAIYKALKHLGIKPWGVLPSTPSRLAEVYFAFNECQFTLRMPEWLLPEEILKMPEISELEEGEEFSYVPLETGTCIEFYLRDESYAYKHRFLNGIRLTLTEDDRNAVVLYITPGQKLFVFVNTGTRLVFHKVTPLYEGMSVTTTEHEISAVVELFKSYIDCCKEELIQAINCAIELFSKLRHPLAIYILY